MADLIDRDALLNDLKESVKAAREWKEEAQDEEIKIRAEQAHGTFIECALRVKNAPAVNRWIPCSERLPESDDDVLVWFEYYRYGDYDRLYQTYGIGNYFSHHDNWLIDKSTGWRDLRVIAWMSLPEPPKEDEKDVEEEAEP